MSMAELEFEVKCGHEFEHEHKSEPIDVHTRTHRGETERESHTTRLR
jgi:hypothetical protein